MGNAKRIAGQTVAGAVKQFAENVSVEMGLGGEITDEVLAEAQRRMDQPPDERVAEAAKELASGLREAADKLDRLESLRRGDGAGAMPLQELIDVFLDAISGVESRLFRKKQLLDGIRYRA